MLTLRLSAAFSSCFALVHVGTAQHRPRGAAGSHDRARAIRVRPAQAQSGQGSCAAEGGQQGNGQQPVFRGGIDFVRVDVIVSDKRRSPSTNLTRTTRGARGWQAGRD